MGSAFAQLRAWTCSGDGVRAGGPARKPPPPARGRRLAVRWLSDACRKPGRRRSHLAQRSSTEGRGQWAGVIISRSSVSGFHVQACPQARQLAESATCQQVSRGTGLLFSNHGQFREFGRSGHGLARLIVSASMGEVIEGRSAWAAAGEMPRWCVCVCACARA